MPSTLVRVLTDRDGFPRVDAGTIDAFLSPAAGESLHALLFFTGDPAQRPETNDVAVILPELVAAFRGRLRAAVVTRDAEMALKARFHVYAFPCLVVTRGTEPVAVLPKVYDWAEYIEKITAALAPDAPVVQAAKRPAVEVSFSRAGVEA